MDNYFSVLNAINVNEHTEQKNGLTYLSWAWAWGEVKKQFPEANYTIYENKDGWNYFTDGRTAWVKTGVSVNGIEHIEYLPIMDYRNKSIPVESITSFDVNKAIQRSLTKACARHGLGLYIYAGEDLPEDGNAVDDFKKEVKTEKAKETRETNKKVEEYNKTENGLKSRYDGCYAYIKKLASLEPFKDGVIIKKAMQLADELGQNNMISEKESLEKLLNEKLPAEETDTIPY